MSSSSTTALSSIVQSPAFAAAGKAMGELGVAGCIGAACVQQKTITPDMVRALSKTIFHVLLPMFIGTNMMKTVTSAGGGGSSSMGRSALAVPLVAVLQATIMFFLASRILIPLFGMDRESDEGKTMAITCCFGNAGVLPFVFAEAMFRDHASLLQQAYAQVSLFSAGWSPFFWSFVPKILRISPASSSSSKNESNDNSLTRLIRELQVFFPPPVVGVVVGTLIGLSPLSGLLLSSGSSSKNSAPLAILYNSFQNLGKAASPLAVLVLTCSLAFGAAKKVKSSPKAAGPVQKWACVSTARFLVSPLVMLLLLVVMSKMGMIGAQEVEPMLWFVCLLESVMPPAQNSVVLLQVAGRPDEAEQMAKFLFSTYATSMLPIVVLATLSLRSLQLLA